MSYAPSDDIEPDEPGPAAGGVEFDDLIALATDLLGARGAGIAVGRPAQAAWIAHAGMPAPELLVPVFAAIDAGAGALHVDRLAHANAVAFSIAGIALADGGGHPLGTLCVAGDVLPAADVLERGLLRLGRLATRLLERHQLQRRNRIAAQIMKADFSAVLVTDDEGRIAFANRAAQRMFGRGARAMRGTPLEVLFPPRLQLDAASAARFLEPQTDPAAGAEPVHLRIPGTEDEPRTLEAARCCWRLARGQGIALILRDITDRLQQEDRLRRIALFDPLTGLPNRNGLTETLQRLHAGGESRIGLALVDLDHFKTINDTLGHALGDRVLRRAAARLGSVLPPGAIAARLGGDEFALAFIGMDVEQAGVALARALGALSRPLLLDGHHVHLEASAGLAMARSNRAEECLHDLLARADLALYKAKGGGHRQVVVFEPAMRDEVIARRQLDLELRQASARGEFELHYQPQIDLLTGHTVGAEALLRWRHPRRGLLGPVDFIDALAASPVATEVGGWILRQACADAARWPQVDGRDVDISINLFPAQVNDGRLQAEVDRALADSGLAPGRLELEITESIALRPDDNAAQALAALRARGIGLAFDDFGTGFASLSLLQRFPIDRVKIDRSFVRDMMANRDDAAIVRSIVLISRNLDLRVVAEGVEHDDQAQLLRGLGCHGAQGFLYAPALEPAAFDRWLAGQFHHPARAPTTPASVPGHG
ncbi:putative bifunctional diguanylate cyclase/phosphodiesterase [Lysobacter sp. A3-1-A15]|uniref:putative bifunctional diguanylate cyclase/phosphodiesterase n=1 Tax=Novilysobacter viscosus TaxID=3098602 RepID=UPI002EDA4811